jgi:hypothetical protein
VDEGRIAQAGQTDQTMQQVGQLLNIVEVHASGRFFKKIKSLACLALAQLDFLQIGPQETDRLRDNVTRKCRP